MGRGPTCACAVNVSARQLLDPRFVERLQASARRIQAAGALHRDRAHRECTADRPGDDRNATAAARPGIAIALDDFGTGYSSLASLEQLPLTRVKLDRSLIQSIDTSDRSLAIARAIVGSVRQPRARGDR
jgi:EAL domain-containing protein (putative c-di-GMP-specific phosphodiesterase class I)